MASPWDQAKRSPLPDDDGRTAASGTRRRQANIKKGQLQIKNDLNNERRRTPTPSPNKPSINFDTLTQAPSIFLAIGVIALALLLLGQGWRLYRSNSTRSPSEICASDLHSSKDFEQGLSDCGANCSSVTITKLARKQIQKLEQESGALKRKVQELEPSALQADTLSQELLSSQAESLHLESKLSQAESVAIQLVTAEKQLVECNANVKAQEADMLEMQRELDKQAEMLPEIAELRRSLQSTEARLQGSQAAAHLSDAAAQAAQHRLSQCADDRASTQKVLDSQERMLQTVSGSGSTCWKRLEDARAKVSAWQLRSLALATLSAVLVGVIFSWYKRRMQRQLWRLTSEKARLTAALRIAETGVQQRVQRRLSVPR